MVKSRKKNRRKKDLHIRWEPEPSILSIAFYYVMMTSILLSLISISVLTGFLGTMLKLAVHNNTFYNDPYYDGIEIGITMGGLSASICLLLYISIAKPSIDYIYDNTYNLKGGYKRNGRIRIR